MDNKIRIRLTMDLPISADEECTTGKEYDITSVRDNRVYLFNGAVSECGALKHEFEFVT